MTGILIIYHANCLDGFAAAYAAHRYFQSQPQFSDTPVQFHAAGHGDEPPPLAGLDVYILDYSYRRGPLKALCKKARKVTLIDHHITAQQDLEGLEQEHDNLTVCFDMQRSGAVLAWEYFHHSTAPRLLQYVQDRDLWRFELEGSAAVNAALMSYPDDFAQWQRWIDGGEQALAQLRAQGEAINRFRRQMIEHHKKRAVMTDISGYQVPVVNCPREIASELLGELAEGQPFAAGYQDKGDKRSWSLRSDAAGVDVAKVAERFGGGGHRRAAGFGTRLPDGLLRPAELSQDEEVP